MKISKLLSIILGLSGFMRMGVVDGEGGGSLSMHDAGAALANIVDTSEQGGEEETEEATAERLAAEEAAGATQTGDDAEETQQQGQQAEDETITVKVDGKDVEIKKSELPDLYKNGLRQKDYTTKTMEVSEQRKAADAEIAKARADREKYATELNNFAITTSSMLEEQRKTLTQELFDADPHEYMRQKIIFEGRQEQLGKAQAELDRVRGEYHAEQQEQANKWLAEQMETLSNAVPDIKDPEKGKKFFNSIEGYLTKAGFTEKDGRMVLDSRVVLMADKAQKYDALMARAKDAASKVKAAPVKVERPGVTNVAPTDGRTQQMKQLAKSGSVRDAGAILAGIL
jgi:hypothetical protein